MSSSRICHLPIRMNPFVIILLLGTWRLGHSCDLLGLNLCTWKFAYNVTDRSSDEVSAIPPKVEALQMCRFRHHLQSCFEPKLEGCNSNIVYLSTISTTIGTLQFMCDGDLEAYLSHDNCWSLPEVQNQTSGCYIHYISNIQQVLTSPNLLSGPKQEVDDQFCSVVRKSRECMYGAIHHKCSGAAGDIVNNLMETVFGEMTSFFGCRYDPNAAYKSRKRQYQVY